MNLPLVIANWKMNIPYFDKKDPNNISGPFRILKPKNEYIRYNWRGLNRPQNW